MSDSDVIEKHKVLDKGYIDFLGQFGDELTIVNAARVSFNTYHEKMGKGDKSLLKYLYKNKHMSPFRHVIIRVRIHAPEVVMRQLYKHVVGIESTSGVYPCKDHGWNELSGRYRKVEEYYQPSTWRLQSQDNKQASAGPLPEDEQKLVTDIYDKTLDVLLDTYDTLLKMGVAREQARLLLPMSQYTTVIWTASLQAILNFISLRDHDHAQYEIREYAKVFRKYVQENFPTLYTVFEKDEME
jgi:thymidylate synthase (FAD)